MKQLRNKKIVMLLASDFSHDSRVLKEATSAVEAGMQVTLLCRKSRDTKWQEKRAGFEIRRYQTWIDKLWAQISPTRGREVAGSQSAGTNIPQGLITYLSIINLWFLNRKFISATLKIRPDLIHANDSITLPAAYRLKKSGVKVVFDAHELYSESVAHPSYGWQKYYVYLESRINRLDGLFSVCQSILDELDQRYHTKNLPQSILLNAPPYQKMSYLPAGKMIKLLYLGNLQGTRDFSFLYQAVEKINQVTLTQIGPGWDRDISRKIKCLPPVPTQEVVAVANHYDIGIIPYIADNLNNKYSTPNKLFEYMMAGLAIAGSDVPEIKRVITGVGNGVLFKPEKTQSIQQAIEKLSTNKTFLNQCKRHSLDFASKYAWEEQAQKQLDLYECLLADKPEVLLKDKKILIGPLDTGLNYDLKVALEDRGFQVTTLNYIQRTYHFPADINLKINQVNWFLAAGRVLSNYLHSFSYDIYQFRLGQSLLPWNLDLPLWKILGKKVIMTFDGDDARINLKFTKTKYNRIFALNNTKETNLSLFKKRFRKYWVNFWADRVVIVTPDLIQFMPRATLMLNLVPMSIKKRVLTAKPKNKIIIFHAPTDSGIKGTRYIKKAIVKLQKEHYPVELVVVQNVSHQEMNRFYQEADIVIDQLLMGALSVVSLEGMFYKKPVICYLREDLRPYYTNDLPVISANADTIYQVLKDLIKHKKQWPALGLSGYKYVMQNHAPKVVADKWMEIYKDI